VSDLFECYKEDYKTNFKKWRLFYLSWNKVDLPTNIKEWLWFFWFFDVWIGKMPFFKILIGINILNVILMWIFN